METSGPLKGRNINSLLVPKSSRVNVVSVLVSVFLTCDIGLRFPWVLSGVTHWGSSRVPTPIVVFLPRPNLLLGGRPIVDPVGASCGLRQRPPSPGPYLVDRGRDRVWSLLVREPSGRRGRTVWDPGFRLGLEVDPLSHSRPNQGTDERRVSGSRDLLRTEESPETRARPSSGNVEIRRIF